MLRKKYLWSSVLDSSLLLQGKDACTARVSTSLAGDIACQYETQCLSKVTKEKPYMDEFSETLVIGTGQTLCLGKTVMTTR